MVRLIWRGNRDGQTHIYRQYRQAIETGNRNGQTHIDKQHDGLVYIDMQKGRIDSKRQPIEMDIFI